MPHGGDYRAITPNIYDAQRQAREEMTPAAGRDKGERVRNRAA